MSGITGSTPTAKRDGADNTGVATIRVVNAGAFGDVATFKATGNVGIGPIGPTERLDPGSGNGSLFEFDCLRLLRQYSLEARSFVSMLGAAAALCVCAPAVKRDLVPFPVISAVGLEFGQLFVLYSGMMLTKIERKLFPLLSRRRRFVRRLLGYSFKTPPPAWVQSFNARIDAYVSAHGHKRVVILCSGSHVGDEGQTPVQLAKAFVELGYAVVFGAKDVNGFAPANYDPDRQLKGVLALPIELLLQHLRRLLQAFTSDTGLVLVCLPSAESLQIAVQSKSAGWTCLYHILDDWAEFHRSNLLPDYLSDVEDELLRLVHKCTAVSPALLQKAKERGATQPGLVPNGVRLGVAPGGSDTRSPKGSFNLGYFGFMTDAWFNWILIMKLAKLHPDWKFSLVGDCVGPPAGLPKNIRLVGRVRQSELAALASHWDVAMVPFRSNPLSEAADPIKTYEYLAMGLPVICTGTNPPVGAEAWVRRVESATQFEALVEDVKSGAWRCERQDIERFLQQSTWTSRALKLTEIVAAK